MRKLFSFIVAVMITSGCATSPKSLPQPVTSLTPDGTPPPSVSWDSSPDFKALRETYGLRSDFSKLCEKEYPVKKITSAYDEENFKEGVDLGVAWLSHCPVDSRIHTLVGYGFHKLGDEKSAEIHVRWAIGLVQSILSSGDGKTPKTPFVTISIPEEYAVLNRLELQPKNQALLMGPPMLDAITAVDAGGSEKTIYFNPALHFVRLEAMISPKK